MARDGIGLAIHTFHDARDGLPPATLGSQRATMWALILPYIEQTMIYEIIMNEGDTSVETGPRTTTAWWNNGNQNTVTSGEKLMKSTEKLIV